MGEAEHGRLEHRGVAVEHVLDDARGDVEAAGDDHLVRPPEQVEVPAVVLLGDVLRVQPAIADRLGRQLGLVPVAGHQLRPPDDHFAGIARRNIGSVLIHDPHLGTPRHGRPAEDRSRPPTACSSSPSTEIVIGASAWP